ncbi:hypothetical protein EPN42_13150 [bacterium]|nr:MAG: hypothetical protein EPN42_13150 [bacterium]
MIYVFWSVAATIFAAIVFYGASAIGPGLYQHQLATNEATAVGGAIAYARQLAPTTGDGATVGVTNDASGWHVTVFRGRPDTAGLGSPVQYVNGQGSLAFSGATAFAILVDSSSAISAQPWAAGTILQAETACNDTLDLTMTVGIRQTNLSYPCE